MNKSLLPHLSTSRPISGEDLATKFSCSRAAISKQIEALKNAGVLIAARSKVGYHLEYDYRWWGQDFIQSIQAHLSIKATLLDDINSTNTWLREQPAGPSPHLALTDWQRAGRGRRERAWVSPPGRQLTFSLRQDSQQGPWPWRGLALAVGIEITEVLNNLGIPAQLKWPNDLWLAGAKLGGILVELEGASDGPSAVIVGVGLNECITEAERQSLDRPASDLHEYAHSYEREQLLRLLLERLVKLLRDYPSEGISGYLARWPKYDLLRGKSLQFEHKGEVRQGIGRGVDADGNLIVEVDGVLTVCHASEVSLVVPQVDLHE